MLNFFLILFLGSLSGIAFMLWRKLRLLASGQIIPGELTPFFPHPHLEDLKANAIKISKRLGYFLLVETIRAYIRTTQFMKNKYVQAQAKIRAWRERNGQAPFPAKEPNKFLRVIAEYRRKIGRIKKEIKEEENL